MVKRRTINNIENITDPLTIENSQKVKNFHRDLLILAFRGFGMGALVMSTASSEMAGNIPFAICATVLAGVNLGMGIKEVKSLTGVYNDSLNNQNGGVKK